MASVSSEAVAAYWPTVESYARRFEGVGGAEFDDLVQEGAISVWLTLEAGHRPSKVAIQNRMKDWIRFVSHRGQAYEILPAVG